MTELIRKLCRDRRLTTAEYERLIRERTADSARELRRLADQTRRAVWGTRVLIRGAVELSSICKNDCLYCIQRRSNKTCDRYRLRPREIFDCLEEGYGLGHRSFLLRGGEDGFYNDELLVPLIEKLKHGVTRVQVMGMYSHTDKYLLICIIRKKQIGEMMKIIRSYPGSFASFEKVNEVFGRFKK